MSVNDKKLTITIGVTVTDDSKGTDNHFYRFGLTYQNASAGVLQAVHEVTLRHYNEIMHGLQGVFNELKDLGYQTAQDPAAKDIQQIFARDQVIVQPSNSSQAKR